MELGGIKSAMKDLKVGIQAYGEGVSTQSINKRGYDEKLLIGGGVLPLPVFERGTAPNAQELHAGKQALNIAVLGTCAAVVGAVALGAGVIATPMFLVAITANALKQAIDKHQSKPAEIALPSIPLRNQELGELQKKFDVMHPERRAALTSAGGERSLEIIDNKGLEKDGKIVSEDEAKLAIKQAQDILTKEKELKKAKKEEPKTGPNLMDIEGPPDYF